MGTKWTHYFVLAAIAALAIWPVPSSATIPAKKFFTEFSINSGGHDEDAKKCGISEYSSYELVLREELEKAGFRYSIDEDEIFFIYITYLKIEDEDLCVGTIDIYFGKNTKEQDPRSTDELQFFLEYYWDQNLFYSSVVEARDFTEQYLRQMIQDFVQSDIGE